MLQPLQSIAFHVCTAKSSPQSNSSFNYADINKGYSSKNECKNVTFTGIKASIFKLFKIMQDKTLRIPITEKVTVVNGEKFVRKCNMVKEYINPDAQRIYKQLKKTHDLQDRLRLYQEMGEYKIIDLDLEKNKRLFIKRS